MDMIYGYEISKHPISQSYSSKNISKSSTPSTPAVFDGAVFGAVPGLVRSDPKTPRKWRCQAVVDDGDIIVGKSSR